MNISLPDGANIQILVLPPGTPPLPLGPDRRSPAPLLEDPIPKSSRARRRDVLFLGSGAIMAAGILLVVQAQNPRAPRAIEPAHAALLAPPASIPVPSRLTQADVGAATPNVDPAEAIQRLLAAKPTITPPPGAPTAQAAAPTAPSPTAPGGKRNAFGMVD